MRTYPALEVVLAGGSTDDRVELLLADIDDTSPAAIEAVPGGVRVFFDDAHARDAAAALISARFADARLTTLAVSDEGWAERSQAALRPVRVGRIVVTPPWATEEAGQLAAEADDGIVVTVQPSMGFGTGHHETTRLCLLLLQRHLRPGARVLDVGTGSGVLAIAARRLGGDGVAAIDFDRDALHSAAENVALNEVDGIAVHHADITEGGQALLDRHGRPGGFDLVLANITGAMLERHAGAIAGLVAPAGSLIASGYQQPEVGDVTAAFREYGLKLVDAAHESDWVAALFSHDG